MATRILIVDDHQIFRQGLRLLLSQQPDFEVIAEALDGEAAISLIEKLKPDIALIDVTMPGLNGINATRQISNGKTKVIALSAHIESRIASEMMAAGASAYVAKDDAFDELADAIRTVMSGEVYVSTRFSDDIGDQAGFPLSPREKLVLQLMADGLATKEIARSLHLSTKTVETHRRNLMEKLGLFSVAELTKWAIRQGLTTSGGVPELPARHAITTDSPPASHA